jgi:hypothetical protein
MALKRVAGTAYVLRDGVQYSVQGELTINPLSRIREPVVGVDGVHGFKETAQAPSISVKVTKDEKLSLKAFENVTNSTITAEIPDGTVYVLTEAFQSGELAYSADDGGVSITFHGRECKEIGA